jgi:hypothetical protein
MLSCITFLLIQFSSKYSNASDSMTADLHDSSLPSYIQSRGTKAFQHFITQTYRGLIQADESILKIGRLSDLRVFCRLDVSVFRNKGSYSYFINEVEASHGTGLFLHYVPTPGPRVITDLAIALRTRVALERARKAQVGK